MTVINTNVKSLIARNALAAHGRAMAGAMQQLATGSRINSASDDAAGLALTQDLSAQARGLSMAVRNANDGISLAQTAEGAMAQISSLLQRMRELAVQAATGTLSTAQQGYLNTEFGQLKTQIDRTLRDTKWNGLSVLKDSTSAGFTIQVGADAGQTVVITSAALGYATYRSEVLTSAGAASQAMGRVDSGLEAVNAARATLGAAVNRLTSVADNLSTIAQNLAESRSRVLDTDYAAATTELARAQILQQAGTAVLAQANQQPQAVLALLR